MTEFQQGICYSVFILVEFCDQLTSACDIIKEAGLIGEDISGLDDCEKEALIKCCEWDKSIMFSGL